MKKFLKDLILPSFWLLFFIVFSKDDTPVNRLPQKGDPLMAKSLEENNVDLNSSSEKSTIIRFNLEAK